MQHFYRYIADGEDKGSALRHAQLDLIKQFADQAMPFYWADFIMVGDGSSSIPFFAQRRASGHSPTKKPHEASYTSGDAPGICPPNFLKTPKCTVLSNWPT
jgi:hypothetical protein